MGHHALKCWHRFDNSYQSEDVPAALAAMHITDVTEASGNEWYPDSGATAHITNSTQRLQQAQPYHGSDTVLIGDGNFLPITHIGSANLPSTQSRAQVPKGLRRD
ncbi:Retrovirus-related Pol polyprotein from transposon RE2 [Cardamine amara subsp. amara]|uniref:Retrovirus-related Pol polyprotein from transposon RE2 n=1 Tax=Cardamine amara subsp. amara TaxID=228776 RepID=A0ABD0ZMX2_CARAN